MILQPATAYVAILQILTRNDRKHGSSLASCLTARATCTVHPEKVQLQVQKHASVLRVYAASYRDVPQGAHTIFAPGSSETVNIRRDKSANLSPPQKNIRNGEKLKS